MNDATAIFERMGVDFEMLDRRRYKEGGIADKERQLADVLSLNTFDEDSDMPTGADCMDEANALRADIDERIKFARQQTAHGLTHDYTRTFTRDDETEVLLRGQQVFAWVAINQVLKGAKAEDAAEEAWTACNSLANQTEAAVLLGSKKETIITPGVSLGNLTLSAFLDGVNNDQIGIENAQPGFTLSRVNTSWGYASKSQVEDGVTLSEYPTSIFAPGYGFSKLPETKFLVSPRDIEAYLNNVYEFQRAPELGLALDKAGFLKLDMANQDTLLAEATKDFNKLLPELAKRLVKKAYNGDSERLFGERQLLVDNVLHSYQLAFPTPRINLRNAISNYMTNEQTIPQSQTKFEKTAKVIGFSHGREIMRRDVRQMTGLLDLALANPNLPDAPSTEPEFSQILLKNMRAKLVTMSSEANCALSQRQIKRTIKFLDKELRATRQ